MYISHILFHLLPVVAGWVPGSVKTDEVRRGEEMSHFLADRFQYYDEEYLVKKTSIIC